MYYHTGTLLRYMLIAPQEGNNRLSKKKNKKGYRASALIMIGMHVLKITSTLNEKGIGAYTKRCVKKRVRLQRASTVCCLVN